LQIVGSSPTMTIRNGDRTTLGVRLSVTSPANLRPLERVGFDRLRFEAVAGFGDLGGHGGDAHGAGDLDRREQAVDRGSFLDRDVDDLVRGRRRHVDAGADIGDQQELLDVPADEVDGDDEAEPKRALVTVAGGQRLIGLVQSGRYALLEDVVEQHLEGLFPGYRIIDRGQFRVTRDASIEIEEDQSTDLLQELEEELRQRGHGRAVRLELGRGCPDELQAWLMEALELDDEDRVAVDGPLDLSLLFGIDAQLPRPELRFAPFQPRRVEGDWSDPFQRISDGDLLLHHPFESFQPVVELVERAADDPRVLAIKQTLYRVSGDSPVVAALVRAAQSGKQVTVLVELKARFDEARNIRWARRLEEAGAHVLYGLVGMKVHAKLLLIIRRDEDGIRRYCHLGTGNYNDRTAHLYTDIGVLTSNDAVGRDVAALFNMLTGFSSPPNWERLAVAPLDMRRRFYQWIDAEIAHARAGRNARIVAKFNSLVDVGICERLYAASQAGVQIDLVVRGMCTLRPGVPGLSENIRVRSVIGRFLEHSRIYCFAGGGEPLAAIASADWMTRNLDRRVESLLLVEDPDVQRRLLELVELYLADNCSARELQSDGSYRRLRPTADEETLRAQDRLLAGGPRPQAVDDRTPRAAFQVLRAPRES